MQAKQEAPPTWTSLVGRQTEQHTGRNAKQHTRTNQHEHARAHRPTTPNSTRARATRTANTQHTRTHPTQGPPLRASSLEADHPPLATAEACSTSPGASKTPSPEGSACLLEIGVPGTDRPEGGSEDTGDSPEWSGRTNRSKSNRSGTKALQPCSVPDWPNVTT